MTLIFRNGRVYRVDDDGAVYHIVLGQWVPLGNLVVAQHARIAREIERSNNDV